MHHQINQIKSFNEINGFQYTEDQKEAIKREIEQKTKAYILGVDEEEFKAYLGNKYLLDPLIVDFSSETIGQPGLSKDWMESFGERYQVDTYNFTVTYSFSGSARLFWIHPNTFVMTSTSILVNEQLGKVSFSFKLYKRDKHEFERRKRESQNSAFANVGNANQYVNTFNDTIQNFINATFQHQKSKYLEDNDFFASINVKINPGTTSVFTAPTIQKKVIPQPVIPGKKEFASEPAMSKEMYDDMLKVIYDSGKNMEKKPALYLGKDEEGLRDQFLFVLETRYVGTTASGETFNRGGKTDIILKLADDGSNLFVGECKFWRGGSEFLKAISQLFDRYLTWRDSKTALILFVNNMDFSNVLEIIKTEIKNHPYYVKENGARGESSFSYLLHLPQDKNKHVFFEVMAFHYDK